MSVRETECDAFGENLVKATLPGAGWTLHHDAINLQIHRVARHTGMVSTMEVEEYFLRRLHESAINPDSAMPLLGKQLRGYVPDGMEADGNCKQQKAGRIRSIYGGEGDLHRSGTVQETICQR